MSTPSASLAAMSESEIEALVAERVMGYSWRSFDIGSPFTYLLASDDSGDGETSIARRRNGVFEKREYSGPRFLSDHSSAASVREEINRRKLGGKFVAALARLLWSEGDDPDLVIQGAAFALMCAPLRLQMEAALVCVQESQQKENPGASS